MKLNLDAKEEQLITLAIISAISDLEVEKRFSADYEYCVHQEIEYQRLLDKIRIEREY